MKLEAIGVLPTDLKSNGPYYGVHRQMIERCYNEDHISYSNYGGRGIRVCDQWLCPEEGLLNFVLDMGRRPSPQHTNDRRNSDWHYVPYNCRWATWEEQQNNRRNSRKVFIDGGWYSAAQLERRYGVKRQTIYTRIFRDGLSAREAVSTGPFLGGNP